MENLILKFRFVNIFFKCDEKDKDFLEVVKSYKDEDNNSIYDRLMDFEEKKYKLVEYMSNNETLNKDNIENIFKSYVNAADYYCKKIFSKPINDIVDYYLLVLSLIVHINTIIFIIFYICRLNKYDFDKNIQKYYNICSKLFDFGIDIQKVYCGYVDNWMSKDMYMIFDITNSMLYHYRTNLNYNITDFNY